MHRYKTQYTGTPIHFCDKKEYLIHTTLLILTLETRSRSPSILSFQSFFLVVNNEKEERLVHYEYNIDLIYKKIIIHLMKEDKNN
jgi:hypothetical protein